MNFREFKRAVRDFGFDKDAKELFDAFNQDSGGHINARINCEEMTFLDTWEVDEEVSVEENRTMTDRRERSKAETQKMKASSSVRRKPQ